MGISAIVQNSIVDRTQIFVPTFNFGQFQRWVGHDKLNYKIELNFNDFIDLISEYFENFRQAEMQDDDQEGFDELIKFKQLGWPTLDVLKKTDLDLLFRLIKFNAYDMLHSVLPYIEETKTTNTLYSIQSLEELDLDDGLISITGVCFKIERETV
ncbi:MAG: hypothetical protein ED556_07315 [Winogradskyella sp.]|uniref:hypothetical protein n=1 Tax=Winogradskyella sp. TaxID=1883156 RepID=UPI000F3E78AE|nr:hypothetical protein [Winogradskyella sp.]RNC87220.1 MAG: hypothetical protein ED556_07315 [Winogradskyella sp.]